MEAFNAAMRWSCSRDSSCEGPPPATVSSCAPPSDSSRPASDRPVLRAYDIATFNATRYSQVENLARRSSKLTNERQACAATSRARSSRSGGTRAYARAILDTIRWCSRNNASNCRCRPRFPVIAFPTPSPNDSQTRGKIAHWRQDTMHYNAGTLGAAVSIPELDIKRYPRGGDDPRCFIALLPDPSGQARLHACQASLAEALPGASPRVRWTPRLSLHLTLRFLGAASATQRQRLGQALPELARRLPELATHRYGVWPNRARPRVLVLELEPTGELSDLAHDCELQARAAGFDPETRPFRAHVTLARLRAGCAVGALPPPPPTLNFDRIALMHGAPGRSGSVYHSLAETALAPMH